MDRVSLINKVLSGEASPRERSDLQRWIDESEANRQEFEDIELLWKNSNFQKDTSWSVDNTFATITHRMRARARRKQRTRILLSALLLITALCLLALLIQRTWLAPPPHLQFDNTEIAEVIKVLEGRFNIEIKVSHPPALKCRYTAVVLNASDERQVLKSIEHSLNIRFMPDGEKTYILIGGD